MVLILRSYVSVKQSKHGVLKQVVPGFPTIKISMTYCGIQKSPEGYLKVMAVLQKYVDPRIPVNMHTLNTMRMKKVPMSVLHPLNDVL